MMIRPIEVRDAEHFLELCKKIDESGFSTNCYNANWGWPKRKHVLGQPLLCCVTRVLSQYLL